MIKPFILAVQFLSRIPVPVGVDFTHENLRRSLLFFPWVGAIMGGVLHLFRYVNTPVKPFLVLVSWVAITGAMHIDGICDSFDGFFSGRERERILEIMKDSRLGSFGAIALVFLLLGKFVGLTGIHGQEEALIVIMGGARMCNAFVIATLPSAREGGMGDLFRRTKPLPYVAATAVLFLLMVILLFPRYLHLILVEGITVALFSGYSMKKIGGVTGDIYGANVELAELAAVLFLGGMS